MDEKKKKIIAIVAVILVAIIAIVVAVVVDKNNKESDTPDGTIVDEIEGQDGEVDNIELEVDENGNLVVSPESNNNTTANKDNKDNKDNQNNETVSKPSDDNGSNGNDSSSPNKEVEVVKTPDAIKDIKFSTDFNTDPQNPKLLLRWKTAHSEGYEVAFREANNDSAVWTKAYTYNLSVSFSIKDLFSQGVKTLVFKVTPFNESREGQKYFGPAYEQQYEIVFPSVIAEVALPRIYNDTTLTIYVDGKEFETRPIPLDTQVTDNIDRKEIFNLGDVKQNTEIKVVLVNETKTIEDTVNVSESYIKINLSNKDIDILPDVVD